MEIDFIKELARRLCAASISCGLGLKSVDYTLKNYVEDGDVGDFWVALAIQVNQQMMKNERRELSLKAFTRAH